VHHRNEEVGYDNLVAAAVTAKDLYRFSTAGENGRTVVE